MKTTIFYILFILLCSLQLSAQENVNISGYVKSHDEKKLIGAKATFKLHRKEYQSITDSLGRYSINMPQGNIDIEVTHYGFVQSNLKIEIKKNTTLDFTLEENENKLNEVVVSNESKKALATTSGGTLTFNPNKLNSVPSILGTVDIIKLLQLTPGVQNSGDANGYLYVRGGEPGHNLMLYADTPIYGMAHLLGIFPFYNADHIQEVKFDKSNLDAKHGGRLSSTVDVSPFNKAPKEFSVQGNLGLLASQITLSIPISNQSGIYVSGRKTYFDEIVVPLIDSNKKSDNKNEEPLKYRFSDCNFTYFSKIGEKHYFTVDAFISGDKLKISEENLDLIANLKWGNSAISSAWNYQFSKNASMKNSLYFTKYDNKLDLVQGVVEMDISSYILDFGYKNSIKYFIKKIPLETGLELSFYDIQPQKIAISNLGINDVDKQAAEIKSENFALFTSAKPKLSENLFAEFGLRLNYYTSGSKNNTYLRLEPRIALNYFPKKDFSLFASYTRQNQYLNLITTSTVGIPIDFWIGSSDGIPSQSSDEFTVGYNQNITKKVNFSFSSYFRKMSNLLEYPYGVTQFNEISTFEDDILIGDGESYGMECMLKKDSGRFKGWLSYTLSWSNRQFNELNNGNSYFAKYDRRHNFSFVGTFDLNPKWSFGLTQIFSSGNRFTMPTSWYFINNNPVKEYDEYNNAQLPNYIRTDVSVNYFFTKTAKKESVLNFSIYNVFNVENPIYIVANVFVDKDKNDNLTIHMDKKVLYGILPSVSWRFKF